MLQLQLVIPFEFLLRVTSLEVELNLNETHIGLNPLSLSLLLSLLAP